MSPPICEGKRSRKVCVIGAGTAGLVSARELIREGHQVVVFEQNHDVGGQWLYDPHVEDELDQDPTSSVLGITTKVHSSVYESLRTNFPRELMGFSDFPFTVKEGRDERKYPGHKEVFHFLVDFVEKFELRDLIRFNTKIDYVGMVDYGVAGKELKWVVRSIQQHSKTTSSSVVEEVFDAVVVVNGHYSKPLLPSIKGMDTWKGKQMHSHIYRTPQLFINKVVVVVGGSISGPDISVELIKVAREVHLSTKPLKFGYEGLSKLAFNHDNFHLRPEIDRLNEDGRVMFMDGACVFADIILYCTGYSYSFPFLDTQGIVSVDDNRVGPLYEHTFPPLLAPSLSFVGLNSQIIPPVTFEFQAKWVAQMLSQTKTLPSTDEMMRSVEKFYHSNELAGIPKRKTHQCGEFLLIHEIFAKHCGSPCPENWTKLAVLHAKRLMDNLETVRDSCDHDIDDLLRNTSFAQLFRPNNSAS